MRETSLHAPRHYDHTQRAPLAIVFYVIAVGAAVLPWATGWPPDVRLAGAALGALFLVLGSCVQSLRIADGGGKLLVEFGPVPLFRRSVRYGDLEAVRVSRLSWFEGAGIHYVPGGGWLWALGGRSCVELWLTRGRRLRLGTDDPQGLAAFLAARLDDPRHPGG